MTGVAAIEGIFEAIDAVLKAARTALPDCAGFIFVEGPGSILGIRIAAMALRAWKALPAFSEKPVYAVGSLQLAAHLLLKKNPATRTFSVFADSRQNLWNDAIVNNGAVPEIFSEIRSENLNTLPEPRFRITQRALGEPPATHENFTPALLETFPEILATPGLLRLETSPDAVNMPGEFTKWEGSKIKN